MKKLLFIHLIFSSFLSLQAQEVDQAKAKVSVRMLTSLSYDGVSNFQRKNFINIHSNYEHIPAEYRDYLYDSLNVHDGRRFGIGTPSNKLSGTNHMHPGSFSKKAFEKEMGNKNLHKKTYKYEDEMIVTSHPGSYFPVGNFNITSKKHNLSGIEAINAYYVGRMKERNIRKGYVELLNEPFVHDRSMHTSVDTIIEMFASTAKAIHEKYPNVKVGGPGHAWPAYELNEFQIWKERMGSFIEKAGKEMDFLSVHLYSTYYDDKASYRAGANVEAILDLIEAKSMEQTASFKPIVISEYGAGFKKGTKISEDYFDLRDWYIIHAVNSKMFQFIQRPNVIQKAVPFICGTATWYDSPYPYPFVLFHEKQGGGYSTTHLLKFYEFWKGIEGDYIFSKSDNQDLQVFALKNKEATYLCLDNLEDKELTVDLSVLNVKKDHLKSVRIRRIYSDGAAPVLEELPLEDFSQITMHPDETAIILFEDNEIERLTSEINITQKYHDALITKIDNKGEKFHFNMKEENLIYAQLNLGFSKPIQHTEIPVITLNGTKIFIDPNEMGRNQDFKELTFEGAEEPKVKRPMQQNFFGVYKIDLPKNLLQKSNEITISYSNTSGFVSTFKIISAHEQELQN
ncbi:GH39 family glycosyl hydrolase [Flammeovirga pacifica]|uniref:Beta-agarase n=1 Tax=Flammeovirga pacifica TaxID=915059 RepID=A0A1S1Z058_FLAPC|nr:hypothetical protein [Flammeovirga pacifica]OHX66627.1 hypothetical protein NH26_09785 [Flammeovirga pacifica]